MARVFGISKTLQISSMQVQAGSAAGQNLLNRRTIRHKGSVTSVAAPKQMMKKREELSDWVPHPRSGIYYPQGQERVMDDVPKGAASCGETYWLRNDDGVDKVDYHDK
ncbi:hypothetical protein ACH5RR_022254 [Cinchona calisaya]|uniref:Late embryogenesis abundant protein n=1 Tax=Cinchona calisaya TaxID=153742 RepID=A0ABD2Z7A0_9GENT